jgi:hypothetical protein
MKALFGRQGTNLCREIAQAASIWNLFDNSATHRHCGTDKYPRQYPLATPARSARADQG